MAAITCAIEGWESVELIGHRRLGGLRSEVALAGSAMVHIDVQHPQKIDRMTAA